MQNELFPEELAARVVRSANIAVVVLDNPELAVPVARALLEGGVNAMELTFRTPTAVQSLRRIVAEVPEMLVSAGTVLTPDQVRHGEP